MKKEDVLKQAQSERNEEYENAIMSKAAYSSIITVSVICILIFLVRVFLSDMKGLDEVIPSYDILAIMFANVAVPHIYIYRKLQETKYIVIGIGSLFAFVGFFVTFIATI